MKTYRLYWFPIEGGKLTGGNYAYSVEHNIITDKFKIVFTGLQTWNKHIKQVRYYNNMPTDKNICLTTRSI
jgi:hypothetical protein